MRAQLCVELIAAVAAALASVSALAQTGLRPSAPPDLRVALQSDARARDDAPPVQPAPSADEFGLHKSYWIPAMDILGFDFLLNRINRRYSGISDYNSGVGT